MSEELTPFMQTPEPDSQMVPSAIGDWYEREKVDTRITTLERELAEAKAQLTAANATIAACKEAGFIDAEGRVRTVARLVNIGKYPSDQCDRIIDVLHEGQTVFVCTPAAAKEAQ